jgi:adenine phosphoribosyltransferase
MQLDQVKSLIRAIPDFPKQGILFQDIFPIFRDPNAVDAIVDAMVKHIQSEHSKVDVITGMSLHRLLYTDYYNNNRDR